MTKEDDLLDNYLDKHYIHKSNWLRAVVLGANDGILSTASIAIGVAAASDIRQPIVLAAFAGLVAGALSMASGEFVSVSSQTDLEEADIDRERQELMDEPELEKKLLASIYEKRGLSSKTASQVAEELTEHDALGAHIRDELGITETSQANPFQAAFASGAAFTLGGLMPLLVTILLPLYNLQYYLYGTSILFLIILGAVTARTGGSSVQKAVLRITFWGTLTMGLTALVGYLVGINL